MVTKLHTTQFMCMCISDQESRSGPAQWAIISGLFLVLQTGLLDQKALQDPWVPLHMAFLGILGAFLVGFLKLSVRKWEPWAIAVLSGVLSTAIGSFGQTIPIFCVGWILLAAWSFSIVYRGVWK